MPEVARKRWPRILGYSLFVFVILILFAITFTIGWRPFIGPRMRPLTSRTFERTPARLERGRYIAQNFAGCMDCHSPHDWTTHEASISAGMMGAGEIFPLADLPGVLIAANLTPDPETGTGNWTDDQLARAIREGIGHDGRALFPLMPYPNFKAMSDEDLASVIVYLRSLPPVHNPLPQTNIIFPVKYLIRSVPEPLTAPVPESDTTTPVKRGAHLVLMASCADCHTPAIRGNRVPGMDFAGGTVFKGPWGEAASANITPDATGISYYDEDLFIQMMRTGYVHARKLNQIMPWSAFRNLTDDDLKAIYAYVRTLKPVKHRVDNTEAATLCKLCGKRHGLGDQN
jgi:mono/diheme cytochrome c family protein